MENWPGATVGVAYALTGVSFFIIISRSILRRLKHEDLLLDDYLILLSTVFYAMSTATNPIAVGGGRLTLIAHTLTCEQYFNGTNIRVEQVRRLLPDEIQHGKLLKFVVAWVLC
jgi:hypothetical protein